MLKVGIDRGTLPKVALPYISLSHKRRRFLPDGKADNALLLENGDGLLMEDGNMFLI